MIPIRCTPVFIRGSDPRDRRWRRVGGVPGLATSLDRDRSGPSRRTRATERAGLGSRLARVPRPVQGAEGLVDRDLARQEPLTLGAQVGVDSGVREAEGCVGRGVMRLDRGGEPAQERGERALLVLADGGDTHVVGEDLRLGGSCHESDELFRFLRCGEAAFTPMACPKATGTLVEAAESPGKGNMPMRTVGLPAEMEADASPGSKDMSACPDASMLIACGIWSPATPAGKQPFDFRSTSRCSVWRQSGEVAKLTLCAERSVFQVGSWL